MFEKKINKYHLLALRGISLLHFEKAEENLRWWSHSKSFNKKNSSEFKHNAGPLLPAESSETR